MRKLIIYNTIIIVSMFGSFASGDDSKQFNPINYGAIIDDGLDDSVAIQTAINDAAKVGGIVFFPAGEFTLITQVYMKSDVTLEGSGDSSIIHQIADRSNIVYDSSVTGGVVNNTVIRNLHIQGSGITSTSFVALIAMVKGAHGALLENLLLTDSGYDGWHALKECQDIIVQNCRVRDCQDDGLNPGGHLTGIGTHDVLIVNNIVENITNDGIHVSWGAFNVSVINNTVYGSGNSNSSKYGGNGVWLWKADCSIVRHNTISGSRLYSIWDYDGFHHIAGNTIDGEIFGNTPGDIDCNEQVDVHDLLQLISDWGNCDCRSDLNGDETVNVKDLLLLLASF